MNISRQALAVAVVAVSLSACSAGAPGPSNAVIARALTGAPGEAQPSRIVATELAYARSAQEDGQFTAGAQYAAPGAIFHTRNGGVPFSALASQLEDPEQAVEWSPRTVVMSCDGTLAVSLGRFTDQDGQVGNYITAWARQDDRSYKWTYDVAGLDDPQPPPRQEIERGDIVVTAIDAVEGLVATCPGRAALPIAPLNSPVGMGGDSIQTSADGTLRWRWEHRGPGEKYVAVEYFFEGEWITAIEESLASPS